MRAWVVEAKLDLTSFANRAGLSDCTNLPASHSLHQFVLRDRQGVNQGLHRRLAIAPGALMRRAPLCSASKASRSAGSQVRVLVHPPIKSSAYLQTSNITRIAGAHTVHTPGPCWGQSSDLRDPLPASPRADCLGGHRHARTLGERHGGMMGSFASGGGSATGGSDCYSSGRGCG